MVAYGIDLGTSFSKLARYDGEKCEALNVSGGIMSLMGDAKNLITAVLLQENGEFAVGQAAYNIRTLAPENYVCEFKRRLGTDTPHILGGKAYSTEDLYTQIFRRMRTIAAEAGEEIGHVVLTYPATYTQAKIDRLRRAANTAGLWSVEALDEPAAAAAFYAAENYLAAGERVLVYDFGGGTFDVSLVERTKEGFSHLCASKGLADCGGADFDRLIFEDIKAKLLASPDVDGKRALEKPSILLHLAETAVKTKHQLSQAESYTEQIGVGFDEFKYTLTREGFERMIAPYVARTLLKCKEAIAEAGLKEQDITRVLPVGGTCSIPYIRRRLEESFPAASVARVPNPGLMVCQGAALAAERKPGPMPEPKPEPNPEPKPEPESDTPLKEINCSARTRSGNGQGESLNPKKYMKGELTLYKRSLFFEIQTNRRLFSRKSDFFDDLALEYQDIKKIYPYSMFVRIIKCVFSILGGLCILLAFSLFKSELAERTLLIVYGLLLPFAIFIPNNKYMTVLTKRDEVYYFNFLRKFDAKEAYEIVAAHIPNSDKP